MIKQKNILGELKRNPNNKVRGKIPKSFITGDDRDTELVDQVHIISYKKPVEDYTQTMKDWLKARALEKEINNHKEMNFLQAFIILLLAVFFFFAFQRAVDIKALQNCEIVGNCSDVLKEFNDK